MSIPRDPSSYAANATLKRCEETMTNVCENIVVLQTLNSRETVPEIADLFSTFFPSDPMLDATKEPTSVSWTRRAHPARSKVIQSPASWLAAS